MERSPWRKSEVKFDRRDYARCSECPFRDKAFVPGQGAENAKIVIVGEAPGAKEEASKEPFVGPAGRTLVRALLESGISPAGTYRTNVITSRPDGNKISSSEAQLAIEACGQGFRAELRFAINNGAKVIVPTGNTALHALGIPGSITANRGSVFDGAKTILGDPSVVVIPTFHPSYLIRTQYKELPTWLNDFDKIKDIADNGWTPIEEHFTLFPSNQDFEDFLSEVLPERKMVAVDIEKTGGLNPYRGDLFVVGLAVSATKALSFPFRCQGNHYDLSFNREKMFQVLSIILKNCPLLFQNALFDMQVLERHGFELNRNVHDIMLMHHALHPEIPHNLQYITSIYGKTPAWKGPVLNSDKAIWSQTDEDFRTYNLRDCVTLHQIFPELEAELKSDDTWKVYDEISRKLVSPVLAMMQNGIYMSQSRLTKFKESTTDRVNTLEQELKCKYSLPEHFTFTDDQLRVLIYGKEPAQFQKAREELAKYDLPGSKLKRNTKKYRKLVEKVEVADLGPICSKTFGGRKTESGKTSVGKSALTSITIKANNRLQKLKTFVRQTPEREQEAIELERLLNFIDLFRELRGQKKLLSTYTSFPVDQNSRVHFPLKIHGTNTGRFASGDKDETGVGNGQNLPKPVKTFFGAKPGSILLEADYSNLELRVLAVLSNDKPMLETFAAGENIHDNNTKDLFGIDETDPAWTDLRRAAKIYIFGRNYGGGLKGIYARVMENVPKCGLTFRDFCESDAKYRDKHPAYTGWRDRTLEQVRNTRKLTNAFGRVRVFLGNDYEVEKEGLNFPIQSTAADIINIALIRLQDYLERNHESFPDTHLVLTVHDSILVETPESLVQPVARLLKTTMEAPYRLGDQEVSFPVDIAAGRWWAELEDIAV